MNKIKVVLVDDHQIFRDGLKLLLEKSEKIEVVGEALNGKQFLENAGNFAGAIVLMDIQMPVLDGVEATKQCLEIYPEMRIIALSMFGEEPFYYRMIEAGASGFVVKNSRTSDLINAIETVYNGESFFSSELLYSLVRSMQNSQPEKKNYSLSVRENEILDFICKGLSNTQIAEKLFISKRTVEKHRANILEKTGTKNTANLVMFAIKNQLI